MKVAIVQFDNRDDDKISSFSGLIERNKQYARVKGYDYFFIRNCDLDLPPYWLKPHLIGNLLERGYDIALWIDTDAVIHNFDLSVEALFVGDENMVFSPDNPFWPSKFNAGVFACKGPLGLELMKAWASLFPVSKWEKREGSWECTDVWAGPAYEQGAFSEHMLARYKDRLRCASWRLLQSPFPLEDSFVVHFASFAKINIASYLASIEATT
jgi:hypothetical protein